MDLYRINISYFKSDGGAMFGVVPKAIWTKFFPADEHNLIPMILRSLVIRTDDDHLILIDNGIGDKQDDDHLQYLHIDEIDGLVPGLAAYGIKPEEITDMILTHLHFDHCGGGITYNWNREPVAVFPEATYWTTERQWDNAVNPNPREADSYLRENLIPMEDLGLLDFVLHPGNFCEGVDLRIVNGHTPGQLIPIIRYKGKRLVFGADLIPTHGHIPVKYNMAYDLEVVRTMKEKQAFLEEIVANDYVLMFQHDTKYECCTVKKTEKGGFRMDQAMTLEEFKNL
ncbi:MAG TPA: MBL fold metallo-hydrolase [Bacteroidales bacterium]|nr:MBL fold metallo-hydrolase [Bacteroidales bacterium]